MDNFLDVKLDLYTGSYKSYKKPNGTPIYINVNSDYLHNIIKALPDSISQRLGIFHPIKQHLIMPHLSKMTYYLQVGTKKILLIKNICHLQIK